MPLRRSAPDAPRTDEQIRAEMYRERANPTPGEQFYPHLVDLREAIRTAVRDAKGDWLDYGAATSPYRDLFENAALQTADLDATSWKYPVDHLLSEDGRIPVEDATFDGVLSTQVLEHVPDAGAYLRETLRVLRPGGRLVLTTHGIWEDHCPVDLRRWTAQGLAAEVSAAGFTVDECSTLTCNARAVLHLLRMEMRARGWPGSGIAALPLRCLRMLDVLLPASLDRFSDRHHDHLRGAPAGTYGLYLALLVSATAP